MSGGRHCNGTPFRWNRALRSGGRHRSLGACAAILSDPWPASTATSHAGVARPGRLADEDPEAVARGCGVRSRAGGSHVYFTHARVRRRRRAGPPSDQAAYVRAFVRFVDRVRQA